MGSGAAGHFARAVNVALGVWLLFSPRLLDYTGEASVNHLIVGPLIASIAVIAAAQVTREVRWVNLLLGGWLVASALIIPHPPVALANGIAVGMAVALLSLVEGSRHNRVGGGWPAVLRPTDDDDPPDPTSGGHPT